MKQQKKPTRSAVQGVVKRAYFLYAALVLLLCLFPSTAFAADDPADRSQQSERLYFRPCPCHRYDSARLRRGAGWAVLQIPRSQQSPEQFKDGTIWQVIVNIHDIVRAIGLALLVLFFVVGVVRTCGSLSEIKRPEAALKLFIRFALARGAVVYGLELMMALFTIIQGLISCIMTTAGMGTAAGPFCRPPS